MRKKAQERKKGGGAAPSCSSSSSASSCNSSSSSSIICNSPTKAYIPATENKGRNFYDTGGKGKDSTVATAASSGQSKPILEVVEESNKVYSMDEIWKDIEMSEESSTGFSTNQTMAAPIWDFGPPDPLWSTDVDAIKMMMQQIGVHLHSFPPNNNNNNG